MCAKSNKWKPEGYRLQIYLPANVQAALEKYIGDNFSSESRVTSAIVRKAVTEFLDRAGYLGKRGGEKM